MTYNIILPNDRIIQSSSHLNEKTRISTEEPCMGSYLEEILKNFLSIRWGEAATLV